jgi:DNA mismatch repair protein MutH
MAVLKLLEAVVQIFQQDGHILVPRARANNSRILTKTNIPKEGRPVPTLASPLQGS